MRYKCIFAILLLVMLTVHQPGGAKAALVEDLGGRGEFTKNSLGWWNEFEYNHSAFRYMSDTAFLTVNYKSDGKGGWYFLTHIIIKNADQINGAQSFGDWGGKREDPEDAAQRLSSILLTNGSYFKWEDGLPNGGDVFIVDGKYIPYRKDTANGYEIALKRDGTLYSPKDGTPASEMIKDGVKYTWGTCEDCLIRDGIRCSFKDLSWDGANYPRCAIGMVRPLEYYLITAGSSGHSHGITLYEEQEIFFRLGCTYARGLDGGGSAALIFGGRQINRPPEGDGRAVIDFISFTD